MILQLQSYGIKQGIPTLARIRVVTLHFAVKATNRPLPIVRTEYVAFVRWKVLNRSAFCREFACRESRSPDGQLRICKSLEPSIELVAVRVGMKCSVDYFEVAGPVSQVDKTRR